MAAFQGCPLSIYCCHLGHLISNQQTDLFGILSDKLREKYRASCSKHQIHCVDDDIIQVKRFPIEEFAVRVKISAETKADKTYRDELKRYIDDLKADAGEGIAIGELIDNENRVTYLRGIVGVGKSVLAKRIALGWAMHSMYKDFEFCYMFECRDLNYYRSNRGKQIEKHDLLAEFLKAEFGHDVEDGDGVLFVIDGLDELYDIKSEDSIIFQLLDIRNQYMKSRIILTGRPHVQGAVLRHDMEMGGCKVMEILGLSDQQIDEYIDKFTRCQNEEAGAKNFEFIKTTKESSTGILPIMCVPQFLNTICCVGILTEGEEIHSITELYSWTVYLLLKQHVAGKDYKQKRPNFASVFGNYSQLLLQLSKISYELIRQNEIIFKKSTYQSFFDEVEKEESESQRNFIFSLFIDVSDNEDEKYQFKHLSVMEFLASLYCFSAGNSGEMIKELLKDQFYEILSFMCGLYGIENGIVAYLTGEIRKEGREDNGNFLKNVLQEFLKMNLDPNVKLRLSLQFVLEYNKQRDQNKQLVKGIIRIMKNIGFVYLMVNDGDQSRLLEFIQMMKLNKIEDNEITDLFSSIKLHNIELKNICLMKYFKFFKHGIYAELKNRNINGKEMKIIGDNLAYCNAEISNCRFLDDENVDNAAKIDNHLFRKSKLRLLIVNNCEFTRVHFKVLIKWFLLSETVSLSGIDISEIFWCDFLENIEKIKTESRLERFEVGRMRFNGKSWAAAVNVFVAIKNISLFNIETDASFWDEFRKTIEKERERAKLEALSVRRIRFGRVKLASMAKVFVMMKAVDLTGFTTSKRFWEVFARVLEEVGQAKKLESLGLSSMDFKNDDYNKVVDVLAMMKEVYLSYIITNGRLWEDLEKTVEGRKKQGFLMLRKLEVVSCTVIHADIQRMVRNLAIKFFLNYVHFFYILKYKMVSTIV